jgi:hypothetical protein
MATGAANPTFAHTHRQDATNKSKTNFLILFSSNKKIRVQDVRVDAVENERKILILTMSTKTNSLLPHAASLSLFVLLLATG